MIWLCGDTHGKTDFGKVEEFFEAMEGYEDVTKDDYLIILGDAGVCWDGGITDSVVQELLHDLPCTVLWIDGNHENFDEIEQYPVEEWHGGKVQFIREDIIHLMRGQVFEIDGKTFFTFGGGNSVDKRERTPYITWWPQEMPSEEEYEEGLRNLEKVEWAVDYVLTHTCPEFIAHMLVTDVYPEEGELQRYFDEVSQQLEFDMWYFGHWHLDQTEENFRCLWEDIVELE